MKDPLSKCRMLSEKGGSGSADKSSWPGGFICVYKQLLTILPVNRVWLLPSLADFFLVVSCTDSGGDFSFKSVAGN